MSAIRGVFFDTLLIGLKQSLICLDFKYALLDLLAYNSSANTVLGITPNLKVCFWILFSSNIFLWLFKIYNSIFYIFNFFIDHFLLLIQYHLGC